MKKTIIYIFILSAGLLFWSCEEDFNLKTDYQPRYSLNCIVRADTSVHTAILTKSYMVSGFDPYEYTDDPFISGADIRLWYRDNVYFFRDSLIERSDTSRFKFPQKIYYLEGFKPVERDFLEIKAVLDNGKVLQGYTKIPEKIKWDSISTKLLPIEGASEFSLVWEKRNNIGWFLLRLQLKFKRDGVDSPTESVIIPVRYNGDQPVYPLPTKSSGIAFQWSAFERTIKAISEGISDKSKIIIYGISVELLVFDENLSKYYSNLNGYMDDFTVRVDQNDFTNIEGGFGIFGSYLKQTSGISLSADYINSLGYRKPN